MDDAKICNSLGDQADAPKVSEAGSPAMTDYWITIQITPQRTQGVRVAAEACQDMINKIKKEGKYSVMAIRPCSRHQQENIEATHDSANDSNCG